MKSHPPLICDANDWTSVFTHVKDHADARRDVVTIEERNGRSTVRIRNRLEMVPEFRQVDAEKAREFIRTPPEGVFPVVIIKWIDDRNFETHSARILNCDLAVS
jgi:hypothetical protein